MNTAEIKTMLLQTLEDLRVSRGVAKVLGDEGMIGHNVLVFATACLLAACTSVVTRSEAPIRSTGDIRTYPDQGDHHRGDDNHTGDDHIEPKTTVYGTLSGTLTLAGSPYRVVGNEQNVVTVPAGSTLVVEPGVVVDFAGSPDVTAADIHASSPNTVFDHKLGRVEMRVYGGILVNGADGNRVTFTSTNPWGWYGINFYGPDSVGDGDPVFNYLVFEKVRKDLYNEDRDWTRGALWAYYWDAPVTITHSVFRNNIAAGKCAALDLMFSNGSLVEDNLFENNKIFQVDRYGVDGSESYSGGGAMCITHGQNTVVRGNVFRGNGVASYRMRQASEENYGELVPRPIQEWPNDAGRYDLGGGAALHSFQPSHDLLEDNLFENNFIELGPAAAIYAEDGNTNALTLRNNRFVNNRAAAGGVIVCNRGRNIDSVVIESNNVFTGNLAGNSPAPVVSGDCSFSQ